MTNSALRLRAELQRDIHFGTDLKTGADVYVPTAVFRATSGSLFSASGFGKSSFLKHLIRQRIRYRQPVILADPHGDVFDDAVAAYRRSGAPLNRLVLIDPTNAQFATALNPLAVGAEDASDAVSLALESCRCAWNEDFDRTPRLESLLRNVFRLLIANKLTLLEGLDVLEADAVALRTALVRQIPDPLVRRDWAEFERWARPEKMAICESSRNRLRRFIQAERVQWMLGQTAHAIDVKAVLDDGKSVFLNLGGIEAPETRRLIGAWWLNLLVHAAQRRDQRIRQHHLVVVDEVAQFVTRDLADGLDQIRKRGLTFLLSGQRMGQVEREDPDVLNAIETNCRLKLVMGGLPRQECERVARELFTGSLDGKRVKHVIRQTKFKPTAATFEVESESWSETEGEVESSSNADAEAMSDSNSESALYAVDDDNRYSGYDDEDILNRNLNHTHGSSASGL